MMPLWPRRALTRLTIAARDPFAPAPRSRGRPPSRRRRRRPCGTSTGAGWGGRSCRARCTGLFIASCATMSSVTSRVAVAVSASTGTPPCLSLQPGEVAVGGTEVVAPLADAVGLVDGDQPQVQAGQQPADRRLDAFGRGVAKLVLARRQVAHALLALVEVQRRGQVGRAQADLASSRRPDPSSARPAARSPASSRPGRAPGSGR